MANEKNLKPFGKGYDPRRNLRGVPKDALAATRLLRKIGAELIHIKEKDENGQPIEYDLTRFEAMIRMMYSSRAPADRKELLERLVGKVPQAVEMTGKDGGAIRLVWPGMEKDDSQD